MARSRAGTAILWVAFVVVALVSGWVAVHMVGSAVAPASMPVLTSGEVASRLTTASPAPDPGREKSTPTKPKATEKPGDKPGAKPTGSPSPQPTSTSSPRPSGSSTPAAKLVVRTLASRGGSVVASCRSGLVRLRTWSPAVGYRAGEVDRGPDGEAEITFVSSSSEVHMKIRCASGVPVAETEVDDDSGDDD